jgi:fatty acid desaturase
MMQSFLNFAAQYWFFFAVMYLLVLVISLGISFFRVRQERKMGLPRHRYSGRLAEESIAYCIIGTFVFLCVFVFSAIFYSGAEKTQNNWQEYDKRHGIATEGVVPHGYISGVSKP